MEMQQDAIYHESQRHDVMHIENYSQDGSALEMDSDFPIWLIIHTLNLPEFWLCTGVTNFHHRCASLKEKRSYAHICEAIVCLSVF